MEMQLFCAICKKYDMLKNRKQNVKIIHVQVKSFLFFYFLSHYIIMSGKTRGKLNETNKTNKDKSQAFPPDGSAAVSPDDAARHDPAGDLLAGAADLRPVYAVHQLQTCQGICRKRFCGTEVFQIHVPHEGLSACSGEHSCYGSRQADPGPT